MPSARATLETTCIHGANHSCDNMVCWKHKVEVHEQRILFLSLPYGCQGKFLGIVNSFPMCPVYYVCAVNTTCCPFNFRKNITKNSAPEIKMSRSKMPMVCMYNIPDQESSHEPFCRNVIQPTFANFSKQREIIASLCSAPVVTTQPWTTSVCEVS